MAKIELSVTTGPEDRMENYRRLVECLKKQPTTEKEFQPTWQVYKYLLRSKMYTFIGGID